MAREIVILDNRDSFVRNIGHRLDELGVPWRIVPSHATRLDELAALDPSGLIVSPGPQGPDEAGVSTAAIRALARNGTPILGICLGHQCIAAAWDVPVAPTDHARHGRSSPIVHDGRGLLLGLPSPFPAARYHALAAAEPPPDGPLEVSAWLDDASGVVMGLRHRSLPVEGVQFHPESVLTPLGFRILARFAAACGHAPQAALVEARVAVAERVVAPADARDRPERVPPDMTDMSMPMPGDPISVPDQPPEPPLEVPSPDVPHPDPVPDQPGEPMPDPDRKVGF